MPLENPNYMRKPTLGGFNPAAPNSLAWPIPRELQAEMAGQVGDQSYTTAPKKAIEDEMDPEGGDDFDLVAEGGTPEAPRSAVPGFPELSPLPPILTADRISQIFQPLMNAIETQGGPQPREVPPPTPALATFLSVLAGTMGAQLTKNPQVRESVIRTLEEQQQRRQAIEDQNYAQELLFDREQTTRRLAALGRQLDAEYDAAIEGGKTEQAMKIEQNRAKVAEWMQQRGIVQTANEQRITEGYKSELDKDEKAAEAELKGEETGEPLKTKDYLARIEAVAGNKNIPDKEDKGWWQGKNVTSKERELGQIYAAGVLSGDAATRKIARRHAWMYALRATNLAGKTVEELTDAEITRIENALKAINLSLEDLSDEEPTSATKAPVENENVAESE